MVFKRIVILTCLLLFPLCAFAQGKVQTYVIKKGDTLWGISQRFLTDPYYWPNLWANNPFVTNPHLIYPGQKIAIYDDRIEIVPAGAENVLSDGTQVVAQALPVVEEAVTIRTMAGVRGFVSQGELDAAGTLVDTVDNRLLISTGETVFLDMKDLTGTLPGEMFSLFETKEEIIHPVTGKRFGYRVAELGTVQIASIDNHTATGVITSAFFEIERGTKVLPYHPTQAEIELRKAQAPLSGVLLDDQEGKISISQYDTIFIDLGSEDGLQVGNLLNISRPRQASALGLKSDLQLPEVLLGSAVVLETRPKTSAALVLKSADPLFRGDHVSTVFE